jgi:NTE family protein
MIAGTSMGCMVGALYSSGKTPEQLKTIMDPSVFSSVFSFGSSYKSQNFRRREDTRALPNSITFGLKNGISVRNSVLVDQGLNAFLDRQFFRFDDHAEFNSLPIPIRCIATDLTDARSVTFARGSIPDAVRSSVSLPAVFRPVDFHGHELVDGGVLDNLPTTTLQGMKADVILAVSLPLAPLGKNDLGNIFGVLQRSFAVAIEGFERQSRKLASVVMVPDITGFNSTSYLEGTALAKRGYAAAEAHKAELLKYAVSDEQWQEYLSARAAREPGKPRPILRVRIKAPNPGVTRAVERRFMPLVSQPVDTRTIEAQLDEIRSDGRYDADYSVIYESANPAAPPTGDNAPRPVILVNVTDKRNGPPFLLVGANIQSVTGSDITRGTVEGIYLHQDLGGYGSEFRGHFKLGYLTEADGEYYRRLRSFNPSSTIFLAPRASVLREPYYIYQNQIRLSERQLQTIGTGADIGWSDNRIRELRVGWDISRVRWQTVVGSDPEPQLDGAEQRARVRYVYDTQDRALVPQYGLRSTTEAAYIYHTVNSPTTPQFTTQFTLAHQIGKNLFIFNSDAGTMLHRDVAQPFRYTLGGPFRLSASAIDEYRGTDYFLLEPAFLRRIAHLPAPLGQSIYLGAAYEAGQMYSPDAPKITRQDVFFGLVAETPLGVITVAPAIGDDGHRKFIFTLGKLF